MQCLHYLASTNASFMTLFYNNDKIIRFFFCINKIHLYICIRIFKFIQIIVFELYAIVILLYLSIRIKYVNILIEYASHGFA